MSDPVEMTHVHLDSANAEVSRLRAALNRICDIWVDQDAHDDALKDAMNVAKLALTTTPV